MNSPLNAGSPDPMAGRFPLTLVTGFLGSGKTTMLARLLTHPSMQNAAVVINEIGEIGIDHDLVSFSSENVSVLANGCICCTVRTDLQETLRELFGQRRAGAIPDFDRVIVETTGLADPAPVVQTLLSDTMLSAHFRLDGIVTLVDAVNGRQQLEEFAQAVKQVALADRILLTKTDLATAGDTASLEQTLRAINASAGVLHVQHGQVEPGQLTGLGLASARLSPQTLSFLGAALDAPGDPDDADGKPLRPHLQDIRTMSLRFDEPFTWPAVTSAMEMLSALRGPDLLRMKGILNVEGNPVVVQCVQHIFHPAVPLDRWPDENRQSRLVFITRAIEPAALEAVFKAAQALARNAR
ncbi:MAG: GTP-binding protein [Pigmentiphaga sp.]|uniref:CobW family GTP-binding protein n=1 Tax=Pigmentiphaga sp. TaxID=1977564 RepID=UPI0029A0BF88|nr:GTP-binding protein [Pigmentiphaga sp.]MDX3907268.1 GTP-binding protein [Pigmentiphaga sp.]